MDKKTIVFISFFTAATLAILFVVSQNTSVTSITGVVQDPSSAVENAEASAAAEENDITLAGTWIAIIIFLIVLLIIHSIVKQTKKRRRKQQIYVSETC